TRRGGRGAASHEEARHQGCVFPRGCVAALVDTRGRFTLAVALRGTKAMVRLFRARQRVRLRPGLAGVSRSWVRRYVPRWTECTAWHPLVDYQLCGESHRSVH